MIIAFARGFLSDIIARKLVEDIIPTDLDTPMQAVARLNERADAYSRLKRYEEPMEISNLLRRNVYDKIVERTHQVNYLRPSSCIQAVNGTHIKVIGETEIQLDLIPDPVSVIIVENISHDMILGEISLRSGAAVINMGNDSLTWYGRKWR